MQSMLQSLDVIRKELVNIKHDNKKLVKEIIKDCKNFVNTPSDSKQYHRILRKYKELDIKQEIDWLSAFQI